jgi:hypothetical protein
VYGDVIGVSVIPVRVEPEQYVGAHITHDFEDVGGDFERVGVREAVREGARSVEAGVVIVEPPCFLETQCLARMPHLHGAERGDVVHTCRLEQRGVSAACFAPGRVQHDDSSAAFRQQCQRAARAEALVVGMGEDGKHAGTRGHTALYRRGRRSGLCRIFAIPRAKLHVSGIPCRL